MAIEPVGGSAAGNAARFRVFAYGSLLFEPELPGLLVERRLATLDGVRRAFNVVSFRRGCPGEEAFDPWGDGRSSPLRRGDLHCSLVLGLEEDPCRAVVGALLDYASADRGRLLAVLDPREGFDAQRIPAENAYFREELDVRLYPDGGRATAAIYRSNPGSHRALDPGVPLDERARLLVAATPREPKPGDVARGLHYLEQVRHGLRQAGIVDGGLEELASAILALEGPWARLVAAPGASPAG